MKYKSVSRIDQDEKHTHGWYVRVRFRGKEVSRFFNDKLHGGKRSALREAVAFRDETERKIGKPRTDRFVVQRESTRKSDMVGVRHVVKFTLTVGGDTRPHEVYEVTWSPEPNVVRRTSVSVQKYGKRGALKRAIAIRREKERLYYGS